MSSLSLTQAVADTPATADLSFSYDLSAPAQVTELPSSAQLLTLMLGLGVVSIASAWLVQLVP